MHNKAKLSTVAALFVSSVAMAQPGLDSMSRSIGLDSAEGLVDLLQTSSRGDAADFEIDGIDVEFSRTQISAGNIVDNDKKVTSNVELENVASIDSSSARVMVRTDDGKLSVESEAEVEVDAGRHSGDAATASSTAAVDMAAVVAAVKSSISSTAIGAMNSGDVNVETVQDFAFGFDNGFALGAAWGSNVNAFNVVSNEGDVTSNIEIEGVVTRGHQHVGRGAESAGLAISGLDVTSTALGAVNTGSISVKATGVSVNLGLVGAPK